MHTIEARAHSRAPRAVVWGLLADAETWCRWAGWSSSGLERRASGSEPGGVGALRYLARGRMVTREEVTRFDPPERMGYRLVSGLPLQDYNAEVLLADAGGGTDITWRSQFEGALLGTGPLFRVFLSQVVAKVARDLARGAERA